jgi:protein O-mannosyl-transferase
MGRKSNKKRKQAADPLKSGSWRAEDALAAEKDKTNQTPFAKAQGLATRTPETEAPADSPFKSPAAEGPAVDGAAGRSEAGGLLDNEEPLPPPQIAVWLKQHAVEAGISLLLVIAALAVFAQTVGHEFVAFDDNVYVYENRQVREGLTLEGIVWAFTQRHEANWHPLTTLSHLLDWSLYGTWAGGHHLTSVLIHALSCVVLFLALRQLTGAVWRSGIVAALFCLHPLHVESVAWVAERKDVLSGLFFGLTLWAYACYAQRPFSWERYLAVIGLFAAGLLCKPMLVTLPLVLLLLDYWPLGAGSHPEGTRQGAGSRRGGLLWLILEKLPLFALSAASCVVTYQVQAASGTIKEETELVIRMQTAIFAATRYLGMMVWPVSLAVPYPPQYTVDWPTLAIYALVLTGITAAVVVWAVRGGRYALTGWLWYLFMLVPVSGLVTIGEQSMADRYTYLPLVGIFVALVWFAGDMLRRLGHYVPPVGLTYVWGGVAAALLAALAARSFDQVRYWHDSEVLFRHALEVTTDNSTALSNLGTLLVFRGPEGLKEATADFVEALRIRPNSHMARNNYGIALMNNNQLKEAAEQFFIATRLKPNFAEAFANLSVDLKRMGEYPGAERAAREALQIDPYSAAAEFALGMALVSQKQPGEAIASQKQLKEAIPHFRRAIELDLQGGHAEWHWRLGQSLAAAESAEEGIQELKAAIKIDPDSLEARHELAKTYHRLGRLQEAALEWQEVLRRDPGHIQAEIGLGEVLVKGGHGDKAVGLMQAGVARAPRNVEVRTYLAKAYEAANAPQKAMIEYRTVLRLDPKNKDALAFLLKAAATNPGDLETRINLALAYLARKERREAIREYREILRHDPRNLAALENLAWIEATDREAVLRNDKESVELAQKALALEKGVAPGFLDTLAAAYAEAGRFPEAVETARKAKKAAEQGKDRKLIEEIDARLKLYESKKPYRE